MSYVINFFGHCRQGTSDKIWGFATVQEDEVYSFWGRRGGNLSFKRHSGNNRSTRDELEKKERTKTREGYRVVWGGEIELVWPGFTKAFEDRLFVAKMSETFAHDDQRETEGA
jgi:hypothetical protein